MKKIVSVLLALSLVLTMAFAVAEESTVSSYLMVYAQTADGAEVSLDDGTLPILSLSIDGASNACAFGTQDELVEGTYVIETGDDEALYLTVTLSDGSVAYMVYDVENDAWVLTDEESGVLMYLINVELLSE